MKIPTPEQVAKLFDAATDGFSIGLLAFAGLRVGEACAVQVDDIDWRGLKLQVKRQIQYLGAAGIDIADPKDGSARTIPIPEKLTKNLTEQIRENGLADDDWLFPGPMHQAKVTEEWKRRAKRAGVSGFTPHSLRHFYASGLIASGADVVTVQRAMGHSKPAITLNVYSHLWPTAEDRTRGAAARLMSAVFPSADYLRTASQ
jgi:integrase